MEIYVINLKERKDRWKNIRRMFGKHKNIKLVRVDAIKHENGTIGCFLSHKKCLEIAKNNKMKNIIVIEDDCIYPKNSDINIFFETLIKIKNFLDNYNKWDIFLGGCNKTNTKNIIQKIENNIENHDILEINKATTTHFMIYNSTSYDFFLDIDVENNKDKNNKIIPIDRVWYNKMRAITIIPFIAFQKKGYSDLTKTKTNYNNKMKNTESILLNWRIWNISNDVVNKVMKNLVDKIIS